jgi:hypothetical protein
MGIEAGLSTYLNARAGLTALVSTNIFPYAIPQPDQVSSYPAVTFQMVSQTNEHSFSGVSQLAHARFQITAYAGTQDECLAVRAAIVDAMDGFRGTMGSIEVQCCLKQMERDIYGPTPGFSRGRLWGRSMDFMIDYTEPVPSFA